MKELEKKVTATADEVKVDVPVVEEAKETKAKTKQEKVDAYIEEALGAPKKRTTKKTTTKKAETTKTEEVKAEVTAEPVAEPAAEVVEEKKEEVVEKKPAARKPRKKAAPKAKVEEPVATKAIKWTNVWSQETGYVESINYEERHFVNTTMVEYAQKFVTIEDAQKAIQALIEMGEGKTNVFDVVE